LSIFAKLGNEFRLSIIETIIMSRESRRVRDIMRNLGSERGKRRLAGIARLKRLDADKTDFSFADWVGVGDWVCIGKMTSARDAGPSAVRAPSPQKSKARSRLTFLERSRRLYAGLEGCS